MVVSVFRYFGAFLLSTLMATPVMSSPSVLCVGADGHVAIEQNGVGYLHGCAESTAHADTGSHPRGEHCGSCNDYTISCDSHPATGADTKLLSRLALGATSQSFALHSLRAAIPSIRPTTSGTPARDPILTAHRTIVILS